MMSGIICCVLFNISHFSPTVCSAAMAKRSQQDSGEERVTAKSKPMMNLIARTPSFVSSSTSVSPGKRSYGSQDPWKSVVAENRSGNLIEKQRASLQQIIQDWIMTVLSLLKSGKLRLRRTIDQGHLIKLLGEGTTSSSSSRSNSSRRNRAIRKVRRATSL